MTDPVELIVEERNSATIVRLAGEIDLSTAAEIGTRIARSTDAATHVVLDLGGLTYLDSAGLAMVDGLARRCRGQGLAFGVVVPEDSVVRTALAVSGLDSVIAVHATRADALGARDSGGTSGA
jgi:anti-sigma B factor antagonist